MSGIMDKEYIWCCPDCGSQDVDAQAWVNINTQKVSPDFLDEKDQWVGYIKFCNSCDAEIDCLIRQADI